MEKLNIKIGERIHEFEQATVLILINKAGYPFGERLMNLGDDHSIVDFMDPFDIKFFFGKLYYSPN